MFVYLFDVNQNNTISYDELLVMIRFTLIATHKLCDYHEPVTFRTVCEVMEKYKTENKYLDDDGIASSDIYNFFISSSAIIEFLRRINLFS